MKTKLEMAHEWAIELLRAGDSSDDVISCAWRYADAMQAEADKREKKETCDKSLNIDSKELNVEEWQPDWSQAPEWANYWVATANQSGKITGGWFYEDEPEFGLRDNPSAYISVGCKVILTDSFGYTGDWRDSLRKRPN